MPFQEFITLFFRYGSPKPGEAMQDTSQQGLTPVTLSPCWLQFSGGSLRMKGFGLCRHQLWERDSRRCKKRLACRWKRLDDKCHMIWPVFEQVEPHICCSVLKMRSWWEEGEGGWVQRSARYIFKRLVSLPLLRRCRKRLSTEFNA